MVELQTLACMHEYGAPQTQNAPSPQITHSVNSSLLESFLLLLHQRHHKHNSDSLASLSSDLDTAGHLNSCMYRRFTGSLNMSRTNGLGAPVSQSGQT